MSYITEIFDRMNLQQIRSFLFHGAECNYQEGTYEQRIREAERSVSELLKEKCPSTEEYEEMTNVIYPYAGTVEEVYMEIGMQCGFSLAMQLLHHD